MGIQVIASTGTVSKDELYDQIMFEIQKRMVDIEQNRDQKRPIENEIADMVVLINKLSDVQKLSSSVLEERRRAVDKLLK